MATLLRPPLVTNLQRKSPIGAPDVFPNPVILKPVVPLPPGGQFFASAPQVSRQVLLGLPIIWPLPLGIPVAVATLPPGGQSFATAPLVLRNYHDSLLQRPLTLGIPEPISSNTPASAVWGPQLQSISRISLDVYPNLLLTTLASAPANPQLPGLAVRWDSSAPRARNVHAGILNNPVILQPVPTIAQLSVSAPITKYAVQVDAYPNMLARGINPNAKPLSLSASAPPPKFAVQVDKYPNLTLSTLISFVTVPNVVGETRTQAITDLTAASLSASVTSTYSATAKPDIVTSQSPAAGTLVALGSIVSITVTTNTIPMPNLVGMNYYEALEALENLGIYLPLPAYAFAPSSISVAWAKTTYPGGIVTGQSLAAGTGALPGQAITLTVSTFPFGSSIDMPPDWDQVH